MKIIEFEIEGLLGAPGILFSKCHEDLNLLTGRNGSGKTSVLKLLWAIISGNIQTALQEVSFQRARVTTDIYECTVHRLGRRTCKVDIRIDDRNIHIEDEEDEDGDTIRNAEDVANSLLSGFGSSVFFPTFRRIEGGFSITSGRVGGILARGPRNRVDLEEALFTLSRGLTHEGHAFVSAISTVDIVTLLLRQYADLSEQASKLQARTSQDIIDEIKSLNQSGDETEQLQTATATLAEITKRIEDMDQERQDIMAPLEEVQKLAERLFTHTGIKFGTRMSFGDAATAVNSDALSAGEKQMLSFVCYNAFYKDSIIIIDEPELSLHVDWQRQLFPILQRQQSSNQFIVATHSPFIYAKYPDKEVEISSDRGDVSLDAS